MNQCSVALWIPRAEASAATFEDSKFQVSTLGTHFNVNIKKQQEKFELTSLHIDFGINEWLLLHPWQSSGNAELLAREKDWSISGRTVPFLTHPSQRSVGWRDSVIRTTTTITHRCTRYSLQVHQDSPYARDTHPRFVALGLAFRLSAFTQDSPR